jgi:hypothetical protein
LAVCVLGLLGERELAPADIFERVVRRCAFAAAAGGHPGAQLQRTELLVGQ